MKKSTTSVFWFVTIFLTAGLFVGWAQYFQAGAVTIENPRRVAVNVKQRTPAVTVSDGISNAKNIQNGIPQKTQSAQGTKPASTRTTKTS